MIASASEFTIYFFVFLKRTSLQYYKFIKLQYHVCSNTLSLVSILRYHNVNINVAVQTDNGLFVPVVRVSDGPGLILLDYLIIIALFLNLHC